MQPFVFQRRLLLSPQVFQQTCRRSSTASSLFQRVFKKNTAKPAPESTKRTAAKKDDSDDIRWFEKDVDSGDVKRVQENPEETEAGEVRKKLGEMAARMRRYDSSIDSKAFHETVIEAFPEEQRAAVAKVLARERKRKQDLEKSLHIELPKNEVTEPILRQFNKLLLLSSEQSESDERRKELWKWYQRAKKQIPGFILRVPHQAWHVLWRSTAMKMETNLYREERLVEVARDMSAAEVALLPEEAEAHYEALVMSGETKEAVDQWNRAYELSSGKDRLILEHGIKLFAAVGDIRKGFRTVRQYLQECPDADPRVLHPLLQASIQTGNDHMAYSLYLTLRDRMGDGMEMRDYDIVIAQFLTQDKKDLALAVFRDMMLQGTKSIQRKTITYTEERRLKEATMRRIDVLHAKSVSGKEINDVSLQALASLPVQWQNKFFFGSWIKKLIGMRDLSGAMKVVELMYQRGVKPDATHVNGIVGGLMRSKVEEKEQQGEAIAWAMIYRRIAFNSSRSGEDMELLQNFGIMTEEPDRTDRKLPLDLSRPVPQCNVETFNVLGLHYLLKQKWAELRHLQRMLKPASITMSSFFMDHLLYMQLYNNGPAPMWNDFLNYTKETHPDTESFNALWHAQQNLSDPNKQVEAGDFPSARILFRVMMEWRIMLNPKSAEKMVDNFGAEIYARIMSTFCNQKDFVGCIVALRAIFASFGNGPDDDISEILIAGLSSIYSPERPQLRFRKARRPMRRDVHKSSSVEQVLSMLREQRTEELKRQGIDLEAMDEHSADEENINALCELIRLILVKIRQDPEAVEEALRAAAEEMGAAGMVTGDSENR
ncbi:hypothetical protein CAC42_5787 [Sphaceloma murrayae]|uniref:Pentatricopeptide repeat protein n=1 Tax=Sphaceloma murrayae TaxID=2082308 RepID=A0A2K1QZ78_9PEZI|nr:hypothetical protein CAC42_5787 [Sphaceloma murrayae]